VLRIHFTVEDLLRVRLAPAADPLWEILLSLHRLGERDGELVHGAWRRQARARLRAPATAGGRTWRMLVPLMPRASYIPDFLTPAESAAGLRPGIEAVLRTPRRRLTAELSRLAAVRTPPPFAAGLAAGDPAVLTRLGAALHGYHAVALAPYWHHVERQVGADRSARLRLLAEHGTEALLANLDHGRWRPPVLEIDYPVDQALHLNGRGLTLVPSVFCWRRPVALADPALPPVLVYPATREHTWLRPARPARSAAGGLAALVGPTRAEILERLADSSRLTGELARMVATSPATVSKHTAVLREAGLITSVQTGRFVCHTLTALGWALVGSDGVTTG